MRNPFANGPRVYLRPLEPEDAGLLAACQNDPEVRRTFFTHTPTSLFQQRQRIESLYQTGSDYLPFAVCLTEDDSAIGVTAYHRVDLVSRAAVFSICLTDARARGKGLAGEVTELMLRYGFDVLNLHRVQLHVWTENQAGVRAYEKCGFQREGVLREAMCHDGVYCDFHVMGLLDREWRARQQQKAAGSGA